MTTTSARRTTAFPTLLALGAAGAAVNGGVFLAFSLLVMPGLDALAVVDPRGAVVAMQRVDVVAVEPPLMIVLFGTALVAVALVVTGLRRRGGAGRAAAAGASVFLLGVVVLTIVANVPLNDALAAVAPTDDPARAWAAFSPGWSVANAVRAAAGIAAAAVLLWARGRAAQPEIADHRP
jgi:uncharacterized membrane protein